MNISQVMKKTLPLILILIVIIAIAVSCSVFSKDKTVPAIIPGDYLTVKEGDITYKVSKEDVYAQLKNSYGEKTLLEMIDKDLLKAAVKGTSNYWDSVVEADIDAEIEKAIYPSGKDELTAEEIASTKEKYMYNNGLRTESELRDYHRLLLARKLYATDKLQALIDETDRLAAEDSTKKKYFTDEDYQTYYEANYKNGYWTIIVPFTTEAQATDMLKQLGIFIHKKNSTVTGDYDYWYKIENNVEKKLTQSEVVKAFIDMYNTVNSKNVEGYPTGLLTLNEGVQYNFDGKYTFNTTVSENDEALNKLYYSYSDIVAYQKDIEIYLKRTMMAYSVSTNDEVTSASNWYTPLVRSYNNASMYVFILKIAEEPVKQFTEVKTEIYDKLFAQKLTDTYINTEMVKLRAEKDVVIFDPDIESIYVNTAKTYSQTHNTTKESSNTLIASVGGKEYTADQLMNTMDKRYGMNVAYGEINYLRLLNNPEFNTIYDYRATNVAERNRILDAEKWQSVKEAAVNEKSLFAANAYSQYGFPSTYGWKNFLRDVYGIYGTEDTDKELLYYFLYREISLKYASSLADLEDADENSPIWQTFVAKMQKTVDEYFKVSGIHLLINVMDENNTPVDPENWTEYQNDLAKELYQQVWQYMRENPGESAAKFQAISDAFTKAPRFLAKLPQDAASQPQIEGLNYTFQNIEVSKFKTAGLGVKYEDLGTFTNGQMSKNFNDAAKAIWDAADKPSTDHVMYRSTADNNGNWSYLVTEFGYHAYINTSTIDIEKWDKDNNKVLPTLQMVKTYLKDSASKYLIDAEGNDTDVEFTAAMKTAITTYFDPIKSELTGTTYPVIQLYQQIKGLDITFGLTNYTREEFNKFLDLRIKTNQESLKYFAVEEE